MTSGRNDRRRARGLRVTGDESARPPALLTSHDGLTSPPCRRAAAGRRASSRPRAHLAVTAAASLCTYREAKLAAFGTAAPTEHAEQIAVAHIERCPACKVGYAAKIRAIRSGRLPRELANVLPTPPVVESAHNRRAIWDVLIDCAGRPFAHETTITGTQVGIAGRGVGSIAAAELVALCIGGTTLVGASPGLPFGRRRQPSRSLPREA